MCRLAAYIGPAVTLAEMIVDPSYSLLEQSMHATEAKLAVQGDGFGFAWYDQAKGPGLYRDVLPAWSDGNLLSLCSMIRSPLFLAHVRASTSGETSRVNCHPFTYGPWSFMHNGQVPQIDKIRRPLEALLPDDLYAARRGTTDSELIFLLMLAHGLQNRPGKRRTISDRSDRITLPNRVRKRRVAPDLRLVGWGIAVRVPPRQRRARAHPLPTTECGCRLDPCVRTP